MDDSKEMETAKQIFLNRLQGPLNHAQEWKFTSGLIGGVTAEVRCPPNTSPLVGVFAAADGVRRVVIAAWFPPETGEEFYADILPKS